MVASSRNGTPVLLDHHGRPWHPDGDAAPGGIALPHSWTFIAKLQGGLNNYWAQKYDEAVRQSREDAEVMKRDPHILALLQERMLAVSSLNWHLEVPDEKDRFQVHVKDAMTRLLKGVRGLRRIVWWLLEALWYGRSGVQVQWQWARVRVGEKGKEKERKGLTVAQAWPVNGDKIGHQFDHTPYVLVLASEAQNLPGAEIVSTSTGGMGLVLRGSWRERFILHKHLMDDVDYFNPEQAEAIHGVGIRSKLFWGNYLKLEWLANITDFFDRVGLGVTLWKYPQGNAQALASLKKAASEQSERAHIFVPVDPDKGHDAATGVERVEPPTSGAEALLKLIEYIDTAMERYVVGQEGSSSATSGSGHSNQGSTSFMQDTKRNIVLQDASFLADSMTGTETEPALLNTMLHYTFPEVDFPVQLVFDVESEESQDKLQAVKTLALDMGVKCKADDARKFAGVSKPADGDELIEPPQQGGEGGAPGGIPGAPSAEGGAEGGDNPLAALMGGAGAEGGEEGEQGPEQPEGEPGQEQEGAEGQGSILDALRMMRDSIEALRYEADHWKDQPRDDLGRFTADEEPDGKPDTTESRLSGWLESVPEGKRKTLKESFTAALHGLPPKAAKWALEAVKEVRFHASIEDLTNQARREGMWVRSGQKVGGLCIKEPKEDHVTLHLDGGSDTQEDYPDQSVHLHAHEIGHAVDMGGRFSEKDGWKEAYKEEIDKEDAPLSKYGRKNRREGFAEYARLMVADAKAAQEEFPLCWSFWESEGLI